MTYDEGGILNGIGGIKATNAPETVLPPELTQKILSPSSNAEFSAFARSMGLLFGASKDFAARNEIIHNNGATNNNDNRAYTVNGVPISANDARTKTIAELFEDAAYFKN